MLTGLPVRRVGKHSPCSDTGGAYSALDCPHGHQNTFRMKRLCKH